MPGRHSGIPGAVRRSAQGFQAVVELDPKEGHAWYKLGSTLSSAADPTRPAGPPEAPKLIEIYSKALEENPYLVPALYKLQMAYAWSRQPEKQKELLERWRQLNPKQTASAPGDPAETVYGEMGRYATVIDWSPRPKTGAAAVQPPRFEVPARLNVTLPEGDRWAAASDFQDTYATLGRARGRFGAPLVLFDADGDGSLDLFLPAGIVGPAGPRDALLLNRGDGKFEEASAPGACRPTGPAWAPRRATSTLTEMWISS